MQTYLVLFRGINVGGKNKILMAELKTCLEQQGFENVATYIASGNVILTSSKSAHETQVIIEKALPSAFTLDSKLVKVLVLTYDQLQSMVDSKPKGFAEQPDVYRSDAIFLMGITADDALSVFNPRDGVDTIWPGDGIIYSQILKSMAAKSRLTKIIGTPAYQSMTIRNWNTTTALLNLLAERQHGEL